MNEDNGAVACTINPMCPSPTFSGHSSVETTMLGAIFGRMRLCIYNSVAALHLSLSSLSASLSLCDSNSKDIMYEHIVALHGLERRRVAHNAGIWVKFEASEADSASRNARQARNCAERHKSS